MGLIQDLNISDEELAAIPLPRIGPGRQPKPVSLEFVRELSPADLAVPAEVVQKAPPIKRLRDTHHSLARCLATGMAESEAAAVTGYSPGRISVLKADPQFQQLLEFYREQGERAVADLRERMAGMGLDAIQELQHRLDEQPETFTNGLLKDIVKEMADRTGHAPKSGPTVNINVGLSERMAKARERVGKLAEAKVFDGSATREVLDETPPIDITPLIGGK